MPSTSRETAPHVDDMGVMECRWQELGEYMAGFYVFHEDADAAPLLHGLPDDRCQSPHWGYVVSGEITFDYGDRREVFVAGDAYYAAPGHSPSIKAGSEFVEFSTMAEYGRTMQTIEHNLAALQAGAS